MGSLKEEEKEIIKNIIIQLNRSEVDTIVLQLGKSGKGNITWLVRALLCGVMTPKGPNKEGMFSLVLRVTNFPKHEKEEKEEEKEEEEEEEEKDDMQLGDIIAPQLGVPHTEEEREENVKEDEALRKRLEQQISEKLNIICKSQNSCLIVVENVRYVSSVLNWIKNEMKKLEFDTKYLKFLITSDSEEGLNASDPAVIPVSVEPFQMEKANLSLVEEIIETIFNEEKELGIDVGIKSPEKLLSDVHDDVTDVEACYWHFRHLFNKGASVHFNQLIAQWMMEGYLGPIHSVKEAYRRGHELLRKMEEHKIIQSEGYVGGRVALGPEWLSSDTSRIDFRNCGFVDSSRVGLVNLFEEDQEELVQKEAVTDEGEQQQQKKQKQKQKIMPLQDMIALAPNGVMTTLISHEDKKKQKSNCLSLLLDNSHLDRQVFSFCFVKELQCLAYFNPRPISLPSLLSNLEKLSILILRDCAYDHLISVGEDLFAKIAQLHFLTVLEVSLPSSSSSSSFSSSSSSLSSSSSSSVGDGSGRSPRAEQIKLQQDLFKKLVNLKSLNFSGLPIKELPHSFSLLTDLRWLILKGCHQLSKLPSVKDMKLEFIDLSGASCLTSISTQVIKNPVQMFNLSGTLIPHAPKFSSTQILTHLLLKDCSNLHFLSSAKYLSELQVLDVSGAKKLKEIPVDEKTKLRFTKLRFLDLSGTGLESLPFNFNYPDDLASLRELKLSVITQAEKLDCLSKLTNLRNLTIGDCNAQTNLPKMKDLTRLEALDLSGRESSSSSPSPSEKLELQDISSLTNLTKLSLSGFELKLDELNSLSKLEKLYLKEIDVVECKDREGALFLFKESVGPMNLQVLELCSKSVKKFEPCSSKLTNLRQLSLAGCSDLETVTGLNELGLLEVLNLSNTKVKGDLFGNIEKRPPASNLKELRLRDCAGVDGTFPLGWLSPRLEVLDLSGTNVKIFSNEGGRGDQITIRRLCLSDKTEIKAIYWNMRQGSSDELVWDSNKNKAAEIRIIKGKPWICATAGDSFLRIHDQKEEEDTWEAHSKQFQICFRQPTGEDSSRQIHLYVYGGDDEFVFKDADFWEKRFRKAMLQGKSVEIHEYEFTTNPEYVSSSLKEVANVAVVGCGCLSDLQFLRNAAAAIKVCFISRCANVKCAFGGERKDGGDGGGIGKGEAQSQSQGSSGGDKHALQSLENLILSNLASLDYCFGDDDGVVDTLKRIWIDCCPKLQTVFSASSSCKEASNLESIHIKFCDKLENLELPPGLHKLHTLHLSNLPHLKTIKGQFPALRTIQLSNLPELFSFEGRTLKRHEVNGCSKLVASTSP